MKNVIYILDLMCIFKGLFDILFHLNNSNLNKDEKCLILLLFWFRVWISKIDGEWCLLGGKNVG